MSGSLFDQLGMRKYLVASERAAFVAMAAKQDNATAAFCLTLAVTGARISEVLAITPERIDDANCAVVFETLKRRKRAEFRAIPVPQALIVLLHALNGPPACRLWPWCRTTAWSIVKRIMVSSGIPHGLCKPKALRHAFAISAGQHGVPLNIVQRWLGHARIDTTAIYAGALGQEERALARRSWESLGSVFANIDTDLSPFPSSRFE